MRRLAAVTGMQQLLACRQLVCAIGWDTGTDIFGLGVTQLELALISPPDVKPP